METRLIVIGVDGRMSLFPVPSGAVAALGAKEDVLYISLTTAQGTDIIQLPEGAVVWVSAANGVAGEVQLPLPY